MKKDEFEVKLRATLRLVPIDIRKKWNNTDLLFWWLKAKENEPYLTWEKIPGGLWQHVKGMCQDLIGRSAID